MLVAGTTSSAVLAACIPGGNGGQGSGSLASTGLVGWLPLVALGCAAVACLFRRGRRGIVAVALVAGVFVLAAPMSARAAQCPGGTTDDGTSSGAVANYWAAMDVQSINPTPAMIATKKLNLGGYGITDGSVVAGQIQPGLIDPRYATGILDGVSVRAFAVGDGTHAIVLSQIETQGYFSAYKVGPYGEEDIRKHAAEAIAALRTKRGGMETGAGQILVNSNHSHGGPDTAGVWGGVPTAYLQLVHDQSVKAIVNAWSGLQPATLWYGTAKGGVSARNDPGALISNQFGNDPANYPMDDELRVFQARARKTGKVFATYLNWSAHPTVLGGGNTLVTADYTGVLSRMLAGLGGSGFEQVGTLGRSQPADRGCPDPKKKDAAASMCSLAEYAGRVFERTKQAIASAQPLRGKAVVGLHSYLIQDFATNAPLVGLESGGFAAGAPLFRQNLPPWFTANVLGAPLFSGRIGDVLISGSPGEPYPQIPLTVRSLVPGLRGYLAIGTAGDFLGYIVAPIEAYPEPIRKSLFDGEPPPTGGNCSGVPSPVGCPSPVDNDNYFFNVSHTFGERLICGLLRGAGEVLANDGNVYRSKYSRCLLFVNDLALGADVDTTFSTGPYQPLGGQ